MLGLGNHTLAAEPNWNGGGAVDITESMSSNTNIVLDAPITLNIHDQKALNLSGNISLSSLLLSKSITKTGAGSLVLSGNNSGITLKNSYLQQGSMVLSANNAIGDSNSTLNVHSGTLFEYANNIHIDSDIRVNDDAYALTPAESLNNPDLKPDMVAWHTASNNTATQNGMVFLSTNTPLVKTGNGKIIINADVVNGSVFGVGQFNIDAGSVDVMRNFYGTINVNNASVLGGSGNIDNVFVNDNATISPDGTLKINNNLTFGPNSTYKLRVWNNGNNDKLHVKENAHLDGRVLVIPQGNANQWAGEYSYAILQADNDSNNYVNGLNNTRFNHVESAVPYLTPKLKYTDDEVILNMKAADINNPDNGGNKQRGKNQNSNNKSASTSIYGNSWNANLRSIMMQDSRFIREFALQSQPQQQIQQHAQKHGQQNNQLHNQLQFQSKNPEHKIWVKAVYSDADMGLRQRLQRNAVQTSVFNINRQLGGFFMGVNLLDKSYTKYITPQNTKGTKNTLNNIQTNLVAGFTNSHIYGESNHNSNHTNNPTATINSYHIGIVNSLSGKLKRNNHIIYDKNNINHDENSINNDIEGNMDMGMDYEFKFGITHTKSHIKTRQTQTHYIAGINKHWGHGVTSKSKSYTNQIFVQASLSPNQYIKPYVQMAWVNYRDRGFIESGGPLALTTKRIKTNQYIASIGMDVSVPITGGSGDISVINEQKHLQGNIQPNQAMLNIGMAYNRHLGKLNPNTKQHYRYDTLRTEMATNTNLQTRNSLDFKIGVNGKLNNSVIKNAWLSINYNGRFANKSTDHGVRVGFNARF